MNDLTTLFVCLGIAGAVILTILSVLQQRRDSSPFANAAKDNSKGRRRRRCLPPVEPSLPVSPKRSAEMPEAPLQEVPPVEAPSQEAPPDEETSPETPLTAALSLEIPPAEVPFREIPPAVALSLEAPPVEASLQETSSGDAICIAPSLEIGCKRLLQPLDPFAPRYVEDPSLEETEFFKSGYGGISACIFAERIWITDGKKVLAHDGKTGKKIGDLSPPSHIKILREGGEGRLSGCTIAPVWPLDEERLLWMYRGVDRDGTAVGIPIVMLSAAEGTAWSILSRTKPDDRICGAHLLELKKTDRQGRYILSGAIDTAGKGEKPILDPVHYILDLEDEKYTRCSEGVVPMSKGRPSPYYCDAGPMYLRGRFRQKVFLRNPALNYDEGMGGLIVAGVDTGGEKRVNAIVPASDPTLATLRRADLYLPFAARGGKAIAIDFLTEAERLVIRYWDFRAVTNEPGS